MVVKLRQPLFLQEESRQTEKTHQAGARGGHLGCRTLKGRDGTGSWGAGASWGGSSGGNGGDGRSGRRGRVHVDRWADGGRNRG